MIAKFFIATLLIGLTLGEYSSPVFLWGVNSPPKSSLQTVSQQEFTSLLSQQQKSHMIVAFQEENLSSHDFLCQQVDDGKSCYAHLQSFSPKAYYASVQNPSESLRSLTEKREYNIVDSNGKLQAPLKCAPGSVTFINFDDITEDERSSTLASHDESIAEISKNLNDCPVFYLYMSTPSTGLAKSRTRRSIATGGQRFFSGNQFAIYSASLAFNNGKEKDFNNVVLNTMTVNNVSASEFDVTLAAASDKKLTFTIKLGTDGYFTMNNISYDSYNFYSSLLTAPTTFSFSCGNLTLKTIPKGLETTVATLKWESLQFQAPFNPKTKSDFAFGDAWDCTPFFTPGILSGLFVVIILLAITFIGICWMVDINTMDRFDDPKGKTITINATD